MTDNSTLITKVAKAMLNGVYNRATAWDEFPEDHLSFERKATHALEFLSSTGLLPAGGMALTAEQVEDLRTVLNKFGFNQVTPEVVQAIEAAGRLNRALFPATEPAEEAEPETRCGSNNIFLGWCTLTARHEGLHTNGSHPWGIRTPTPTEPAEEETKAEAADDGDVITDAHEALGKAGLNHVQRSDAINQLHNAGLLIRRRSSAPVVPAPNETEWPSLLAVPTSVVAVKDRNGFEWRRRSNGTFCGRADCGNGHPDLGPFVADKER